MRLKKDGEQYQMDKPIQKQGKQDGWRGTREQTLAYYRRIVEHARGDLLDKHEDYSRNFGNGLLLNAVSALQALEKYLAEVKALEVDA